MRRARLAAWQSPKACDKARDCDTACRGVPAEWRLPIGTWPGWARGVPAEGRPAAPCRAACQPRFVHHPQVAAGESAARHDRLAAAAVSRRSSAPVVGRTQRRSLLRRRGAAGEAGYCAVGTTGVLWLIAAPRLMRAAATHARRRDSCSPRARRGVRVVVVVVVVVWVGGGGRRPTTSEFCATWRRTTVTRTRATPHTCTGRKMLPTRIADSDR